MAKSRVHIIDLLRKEEAQQLCVSLGLPDDRPYAALRAIKLHETSRTIMQWWGFFGLPAPPPRIVQEPRIASSIQPQYSLFAHQRNAVRKVQALLSSGSRRVLLHMPTGAGKTRMAMTLVADHLRRNEPTVVCWLANSEELCEQAAEEFEAAWRLLGDRPLTVAPLWGGSPVSGADIEDGLIIGGFAKVYSRAVASAPWLAELGDRVTLTVVDEAHQVIAPTYQLVVDGLLGRRSDAGLLGLTATPGRTWADIDLDALLSDYFSRNKVSLEVEGYDSPVEYLIAEGYLARPTYRELRNESTTLGDADLLSLSSELDIPPSILRMLAEDDVRNLRIIKSLEELITRHKRILVFSATVEHAEMLAAVLCSFDIDARAVTAQTDRSVRANTVAWYKQASNDVRILVNFGVFTAGFDAPRTSATLIARPTKSLVLYSQMVGRATRGVRAGGNEQAEIVTVVDTQLTGFGNMADAFVNWEDVWRQE